MKWPVVPICDKQLLDVRSEDLLNNGLYRKCYPLRAGGGYDYYARNVNDEVQFVVQLYGCPLKCWYCYVTKQGMFGKPVFKSTNELIKDFIDSKCGVFHLMGGAPAIYVDKWHEISDIIGDVFHSDFLLIESKYSIDVINNIKGTHAVSLKDNKDIGVFYDIDLMLYNRKILESSNLKYYYTMTGDGDLPNGFDNVEIYRIPILQYEAIE